MGCNRSVSWIYVWGNFDAYTDNNLLTNILTTARLDAVAQCWVAALANYDFHLHYETSKSNVEANTLSHILWQQTEVECINLDCQMVKVIIGECTVETSLFEAYSGKMVKVNVFQGVSPQENTLFLGKVEVDQILSITKQEWIKK